MKRRDQHGCSREGGEFVTRMGTGVVESVKQVLQEMRRHKIIVGVSVLILCLLAGARLAGVNVRILGHLEGVFVLRGGGGRVLVTDDVMLEESKQIIWALPVEPLKELFEPKPGPPGKAYLDYEWFRWDGSGFVRSVFADGRKLRICFSRFIDDAGGEVKGLVLGGGLPFFEGKRLGTNYDDTGMAYFDGTRWYHIWCNANEAFILGDRQDRKIEPHSWEFRGSRVVEADAGHIVIVSHHRVRNETTLLNVDRYALFQAGKPYFILVQKVRNGGELPARYSWVYADEPWVGNYGSSSGNVGWSSGGFHYYEGRVDTTGSTFAGLADMGNPVAGEIPGSYSGMGNFIQWLGRPPTFAYFANQIGRFAEEGQKVPFASLTNRCIGLEWWPEPLPPGGEHLYVLAIGMAVRGGDGKPVKSEVDVPEALLERIRALR